MIWSYLLGALGLCGLYLAGKKKASAWVVGVVACILWGVYGIVSEQWGFLITSPVFTWVHARNWFL